MRRLVVALLGVAAFLVPVSASAGLPRPIVLIPGWHGGGSSFDTMIPVLEGAGLAVLDFEPDQPGTQALTYHPDADGQHIDHLAARIVQPRIEAALARAGYGRDAHIDIVGYSMGGLVARYLLEQTPNWAARTDTLVMLGTPSHGTFPAWIPGTAGGFGRWNASGGDMRPGSPFLNRLGTAEPAGERYVTIGGNPAWLPLPRADFNGDGVAHGYDGLVPAESPFLTGSEQYIVPETHAGLVQTAQPIDLAVQALGREARVPPLGTPNLTGEAVIRLERVEVATDQDWGTKDDLRFDFSIDPDGRADGFVPAGRIGYHRDPPFTQDWGDSGPTVTPFHLPGTSPRLDVRVDLVEHDPWGDQVVASAVFGDVMLSEDLDGMDYYEATVPLGGGKNHRFRISVNGVTARRM